MHIFPSVEKAVLAGVEVSGGKTVPLKESMEELARLAESAGAKVSGQIHQKREKPDPRYYIGEGKLNELALLTKSLNADLVIFDPNLTPAQERNLEEYLGIKVIDRTELILDIFAQHARSREGKTQVELAQLNYLLTRLTGRGVLMSRLGGGIGTRGPGETKLESDRRRLRKRISILKHDFDKLVAERLTRREKRRKNLLPLVALVGYTNAGKSSLLNLLSKADVLTMDKLFATLDTTTRRTYLPDGTTLLLTDTVGFIRKIPHQLIAAFRATLEEATEADLLLHVVDASHPFFEDQISAVYTVLEELNCSAKPIITVFNKIDKLNNGVSAPILKKYSPALATSAVDRLGIDALKEMLSKFPFPQHAQPPEAPA